MKLLLFSDPVTYYIAVYVTHLLLASIPIRSSEVEEKG